MDTWIVRDRGDGLRGSLPTGLGRAALERRQAERAITSIMSVKRVGTYSIVECQLSTGRTHQIRIHLAEVGFRLCGERLYTHKLGETLPPDESGAPRQALHSWRLEMMHPMSGERLVYESGWPEDLRGWVDGLSANL